MKTIKLIRHAKIARPMTLEAPVSPAEFEGERRVLVNLIAVEPMDSNVIAQLSFGLDEARDFARRILAATGDKP